MSLLYVDNLTAGYGKSIVIHGISIRAEEGEIVGIVGPNGSGKSTLLKSICGLTNMFGGKVTLAEHDITGIKPHILFRNHSVSYVPQTANVFSAMTVAENLEMGAIGQGVNDGSRNLEQVFGLFPRLKERIGQKAALLSGGERQMLAISRALVTKPKLLLLDEPAASLSPKLANELFDTIVEINRLGTTIITIEQNVRRTLSIAHRGYVLVSGKKALEGESRELLKRDLGRVFLGVTETEVERSPARP
jgi:ABC-type branched-subunit amino acid transport system ATPase component